MKQHSLTGGHWVRCWGRGECDPGPPLGAVRLVSDSWSPEGEWARRAECCNSSVHTHFAAVEQKKRVWGWVLKMDGGMVVTRRGRGRDAAGLGHMGLQGPGAALPLKLCGGCTVFIVFFSNLYVYVVTF